MKKKGFTLIELLGVIVLLAAIGLLVVPVINNIIKDNKERVYNEQVNRIVEASRKWGMENTDRLSETRTAYIEFDELVSGGFLTNNEIKDPRDESVLTGCVKVNYLSNYNQYEYTYDSECVRAPQGGELVDLSINFGESSTPSNGWHNEDFYVNINIEGAVSYEWCGTTNSSCEPNTLVNSNTGSALVNAESDSNVICVIGYDSEGNYTNVVCSDIYKLDKTGPTFTGLTEIVVQKGETVDLTTGVSVSDSLSGTDGTFTVTPENVDTTNVGVQTVTYKAIDKAGNETVSTRTIRVNEKLPEQIELVVDFKGTTNPNSNGWYNEDINVSIEITGASSYKWCKTTNNTCEPDTLVNGNTGTVTIDTESDSNIVCVIAYDQEGNYTAKKCSDVYKLDKTGPEFVGLTDKTVQKGETVNLREGVTVSDDVSGVEGTFTVSPEIVDTSKAGTTVVTYKAVDKAGNETTETRTITVDAEGPSITFRPTTNANSNGWYKENVSIEINVEDKSGTGISTTKWCETKESTCTPSNNGTTGTVTIESQSTRICATATDNNGKTSGVVCSDAYKLDKTAPTFTGVENKTIQKGTTFDVRNGVTVNDALSEIDGSYTVTPSSVDTSKAGTTTLTYSVTDKAGNTKTETRTITVDAPAPTVTFEPLTEPNNNGWYNSNIDIKINVEDNSGLGLNTTKWCETTSSCTPDNDGVNAIITTESENVKICAEATDKNGKSITTCSDVYKLDKTGPVFSGTEDIEINRTDAINLTNGVSVSDSLSKVNGIYTVSPESVDTNVVGSTVVTYKAVDKAGNETTEYRTVTVIGNAPVITFTPTVEPNSNGWHKNDFNVTINVVDDSGLGITSTSWCETTSSCTPTTSGAIATVTLESANVKVCATATDGSGKSTTECSNVYKLDKTLPYFNGISDITIQKGSTFDVKNGVTASDALSEIDGDFTVSPTSVDTSKAGTTTLTYSVTDKAGNTNSVTRKVIVDAEAPTITFTPAAEPNSNGWYKSNFFVTVNVEDQSGLGIDSTKWCGTLDDTCTPNTSGTNAQVSLEGATTRICAQSTDKNGKTSEVYCSDAYKLDKTAPEFTGISNTEVNRTETINLRTGITAEDKMSGISDDYTVSPESIDTSKVGSTTVTYSVTDDAGNTTTTTRTITVIGQAPSITFSPITSANANGWYKENFEVEINVVDDSGYGITSTSWCETTSDTCTASNAGTPATVTLESANVKVCAEAVDGSGKSTTTCSSTYKLDKTLPYFTGISDITIQKGTSFSPTSGISADDALSKVDGTFSVTPTSVDTSKAGTTTLTYSVTDKAGNTNSVTRKVVVDADAPILTFTPTTEPNTNGWYKSNFFVTVNVEDQSGLGIDSTKWCGTLDDTCTPNTSGTNAQVSLEGATTRVCAQSTDNNNKTSEVYCSDAYKLDKTAPSKPSITGGSNSYVTSASISLSAASTDTTSGGITYEYYVTSSSTAPTASTTATGTYTSPMTFNTNRAGDYIYVRAKDQAGNIGEWSSAQRLYIDINNPTISAKGSSYTITEGDSNVISSTYFNIDKNGSASISSTICSSNIDGTVSNTSSLSVGTHTITCTVAKTTNKSAKASTEIVVEAGEITADDLKTELVTTGDGLYKDSDGVYRYKGSAPNNWIKLGNETYRILAIETQGIKVIRSEDVTNSAWSSVGTTRWDGTTAQTYLSNTYYSNLSSVSNYIVENATWNIGGVTWSTVMLLNTVKSEEKATTWTGKIGLMTFSEYIQAQSPSSSGYASCSSNVYNNNDCGKNNWLHLTKWTWTINMEDYYNTQAWALYSGGGMNYRNTAGSTGIRPVVVLKPTIKLSGSGTSGQPFTIIG